MKLLLPVAAIAFTLTAHATNWPQWRGPSLDGTSPEKNLPLEWSAGKGVKWKTPMPGFSGATPAIWGDSIFVSSPDANKNLVLLCLNKKDGAIRWQKQLAEGADINKGKGNMASPSPVTDGKTVWVLFGTGDMAALDFSGKVLWQRNLGADYGKFAIMWLYGSSPLLFDGRLYVQVLQRSPAPEDYPGLAGAGGERESYLLALDPQSGKTLWKHVRQTPAVIEAMESYATPVPHKVGGKTQLLVVGGDCLSAHDPATGKEIWRGFGLNPKAGQFMRIVPSPVSAGDLAIACGPKKEPMLAFRTDKTGDITESGVAWKFDEKKTPDVCTPVYSNGKLFALDGDKAHALVCFNAKTGEKLWEGQLPDSGTVIRASPTLADGRLYIVNEKGTTYVVDATANEFKLLATNVLPDENVRGSIAVSDGQLFIRGTQYLYCVGK